MWKHINYVTPLVKEGTLALVCREVRSDGKRKQMERSDRQMKRRGRGWGSDRIPRRGMEGSSFTPSPLLLLSLSPPPLFLPFFCHKEEEGEGGQRGGVVSNKHLSRIIMQGFLTIANQCSTWAVDHPPVTECGHTRVEPLLVIADPVQYQDTGTRVCQSTRYCHISNPYCPISEESRLHHHWGSHSRAKLHGFKEPLNGGEVLVRSYGAGECCPGTATTGGPCCDVYRLNLISGYCRGKEVEIEDGARGRIRIEVEESVGDEWWKLRENGEERCVVWFMAGLSWHAED